MLVFSKFSSVAKWGGVQWCLCVLADTLVSCPFKRVPALFVVVKT